MKILDGRIARASLMKGLAARFAALAARGAPASLAIVQVGARPDSTAYVNAKKRFGTEAGAAVKHILLPEGVGEAELVAEIRALDADPAVGGVIVQLPLPDGLKSRQAAILAAVSPAKDVDAITGANELRPATARGVGELLDFYGIGLAGKKACVIGRSALVGAPTAELCRERGASVTVCHSKTADLAKETAAADVIIVAAGKPGLVGAAHVRPGQTVVDIGISREGDALVGDVDAAAAAPILGPDGALSPVPGGVGPMTVLALFENLADLCENNHHE
ncbi:MAG: bifunctional 5,10-methylenetetrahydrofolate dehydrogenase/5,10-methenyltetrahydrofolate cyclohydrolase [Patescibacteria group bacterium]|nr:bifunctional 5,10-methylenetetrahydrofolate dehydrogenase/5,10-methenyltetrahydrofolate cyclohydrolase [Patescibacteria group bacterium]